MESNNDKTHSAVEMKVKLLKDGPPNETIFVLGATGSGKTTLIANILADRERFLIFDAKNDYDESAFENTVTVFDERQMAVKFNAGANRVIFKLPATESDSDLRLDSALEWICLYQKNNLSKQPLCISLDELNRFCESTRSCPEYLSEIIQRGRDYKIVKIFGAQWFNKIPPFMRDSFSEIYTFRHSEKVALCRLEDYGLDSETVKTLPAHTCLHSGKNGVQKIRLIPDGKFSTPKHNAVPVPEIETV